MNCKRPLFRLLWLALSLGLSFAVSSVQAQILYAATGSNGVDGQLFTVNPTNGDSTLVGDILVGESPIGVTGLAFQASTGTLYGVTTNGSPNFAHSLVTIDPTTAAATVVGDLGNNPAADIAFGPDGTLFGWQARTPYSLMSIDLTTGTATQIGTSGIDPTSGGGLEFGTDGVLYLSAQDTDGTGVLQTVDPVTGTPSDGPTITGAPFTDGAMNSLTVDASGTMFAANSDRASTALVRLTTIDLTTGAVTDLGALPDNTDAIAFSPVPAPGALLVTILGALPGAGLLLRRRKR